MRVLAKHGVTRVALAILLAMLPLCAPVSAAAAPAASKPATASLDAKKAEQEAAINDLARMRDELDTKVSEYVSISRELEQTRNDVSEVTTQLAEMDLELIAKETAIVDRAVQLYRSDRMGMLGILLSAQSVPDLMDRLNYLSKITERDAQLIVDIRKARAETAYLQESLSRRVMRLSDLQDAADAQRSQIESDLVQQQDRAIALGQDIAALMRQSSYDAAQGSDPNGSFNPDAVISDTQFRAAQAMTVADIQAFLDQQPGTLRVYRAADHNGTVRTVAEMVAEAAVAWNVNPKVLLVKLQKEQSLLSKQNPSQNAYDWAMGCGKADSRTFYQYQGFGKQIWFGAQKLSQNAGPWKPGIEMKIDGSVVRPINSSTYSLYKYTPHFRGTMSFWLLYWRYFGDPLAP